MNTRRRILHISLLMVLMLAQSVGARAQASITINFDGNGGSGTPHSLTIYEGIVTEYLHNEFTMYGKQFAGWSVDVDDIGAVRFYEGDGITYDAIINEFGDIENMTFYAQWIPQQENSCGTGEAAHPQIMVIRNENPFPFIVWDDEHKVPLPEDLPDNWRETVWDRKYSTCIDNWRYTVHFYYRPANFEYDTIRISDQSQPDQIDGKPVVWYGGTGYADEGDNHYIVIPVTYVELENSITQPGQGINELQLEGEGFKMYGHADDDEIIYTYTLDHEWLQSHGYSRHENETIPETVEYNGKTYGFYYTIQVQQVNKYDPFHMDDIVIWGGESVNNDKIGYNGDKVLYYHNPITDTWPMFTTLIDWGDGQSYWHQDPQYIFTATGDINTPGYAFELGVTYYPASAVHNDTTLCGEGSVNFGGKTLPIGIHTNVEWVNGDEHRLYKTVNVVAPMDADGIYAQPAEGGSVAIQGHTPGLKYCYGETITLVVTPEECYEMAGWADDNNNKSTTRSVTLTEGLLSAYQPILTPKTFTVKVQSNDATLGSVSPASKNVNCGESVNITATPAEHCRLTGWSDEPDNQSLTRSISPTSDTTITANFETIIITIHDEDFPENVDVTGKEDDETYEHGKELTFTAATVVCKNFNGWKDGTSKETTSRTFIVGVDNLTADKFIPKYEDKVYSGEETITIYDSQKPYHWHNNDYNTSGDYSIVLTTAQGCDSTAVLHLTITADPTHEVNVTPEDDSKGDVDITDENGQPINPGDDVEAGSTITLEAKPKTCQEFEKWSDGNTDKTRSITVNSDITLQAIFKDFQPTVTINKNGQGVVKVNGENVQTMAIACGSDVSLVASHLTGYAFENWSDGVTEPNRTLTDITKDTTLTANFRQLTKYYVTIEPQDPSQGSVIVEVYPKNSDGKYEVYEGFQIRFLAQAKPGYKFKQWSNGGENYNTSATINSDSTIYAIFEPKTRTVHIDINDSEYGSVSVTGEGVTDKGNGGYEVQDGKTILLTATPTDSECDEFIRWLDTNTSENPRTLTITEDKTISAGFTHKTYSIQINPNHGTVEAYNKDNQLITNYTVNCGEDVTLVAVPATGYRFDHWEDDPEAGATRVINNVHANITNKVVFVALTINIKTDDGEDVTIELTEDNDGDGQIGIGDKITITAPTKDCKEFEKWSDENTDNPRVIEVTGDINLTAQYRTVKYTITTQVKPDGEDVHGTTSAEIVNE